jgi:ATP-dependent Clp protease adaptor protein ClpS
MSPIPERMSDDPTPPAPGSPAAAAVAEPPVPAGPQTTTKPKAATRPDQRVDRLPPYRVLLHNDDHNEMFSVVRTIVELTPLRRPQATQATFEAHLSGVALLLVTHKERAELYQEQFASKRLIVTIEPGP